MSWKTIIADWLEEGFTRIKQVPDVKDPSRINCLLPYSTDETGRTVSPKPLFPAFMKGIELEPDFLAEYLEIIDNGLRVGADKPKLSLSESTLKQDEIFEEVSTKTHIEYERKNIFLSRAIFSLFEMPDYLISKNSSQYELVLLKNESYLKSIEARKTSPDSFNDKETQAGHYESDEKCIETKPIIFDDKNTHINKYLMTEHYDRSEIAVKAPPKSFENFLKDRTKFRNYEEFLSDLNDYPSIYNRLENNLYVLEKTLDYNSFKKTILSYNEKMCPDDRLTPNVKTSKSDAGAKEETNELHPSLALHLQFHLPAMEDHYQVACIEFNPLNPSIFIGGYGASEDSDLPVSGYVLCWNIHKCGHPERIHHMQEAVTCGDFSKQKPYLIVVGMRYGLIAVLDLRSGKKVTNRNSALRPAGTIKGIRWLKKKYSLEDDTEIILAVATDGTVTSWTYEKTLEGRILRYIKRGDTEEHEPTVGVGDSGDQIDANRRLSQSGRRASAAGRKVSGRSVPANERRMSVRSGSLDERRNTKRLGSGDYGDGKTTSGSRRLLLAVDAAGTCVEIKPGGNDLYMIGTIEGQALVANASDTGDYIETFNCHGGPLFDLKWSPIANNIFVTAGNDKTLKVWEVSRQQASKTLRFTQNVLRVSLSSFKSTLFAAMSKHALHVFDLSVDLHRPLVQLESDDVALSSVTFCPRKHWVLLGDSKGTIRMYELTGVSIADIDQTEALRCTFMPDS